MSSQPLLDHEDSVSLDLEDHLLSHNIAHPEQHLPAAVTKRGLWAFVSGLVLTAAAITLVSKIQHHSARSSLRFVHKAPACVRPHLRTGSVRLA